MCGTLWFRLRLLFLRRQGAGNTGFELVAEWEKSTRQNFKFGNLRFQIEVQKQIPNALTSFLSAGGMTDSGAGCEKRRRRPEASGRTSADCEF